MENSIKTALIIGGNGFIGFNLSKRLKKEGWYVTVVDIKEFQYGETVADEVIIADARTYKIKKYYDRIYQLAADMGGAGYIFSGDNDADIMSNSLAINLNVVKQAVDKCGTLFYSSSVCAYANGVNGKEEDMYPANPPYDYGWEKLISERLYQAYNRNYGLNIRIARFHNCFGPYGTYTGGKEKAPAAMCRKIIESDGEIEIWGDGEQIRPFIYIEDLLDGVEALMRSNYNKPINIGPSKGITINDMITIIMSISDNFVSIKHIDGPTGELERKCNNELALKELNWQPKWKLEDALKETYNWIKLCLKSQ